MTTQLLATSLVCVWAVTSDSVKAFLFHPAVMGLSLMMYIVSICALVCCRQDRKVPMNYVWLAIFTLCVSVIVGSVCARTKPIIVAEAALLTTAVVIGITVYAFTTKNDFTVLGPLMFIVLFVFIMAGILCCFFGPAM